MNRQEFNSGFMALLTGFAYAEKKTNLQTEDLYFEMLKEIPVEVWNEGIKECLRELTFFPTIHDLGVACYGETKEHMEDRCDPLRFKQNYQVRIEAVSWQENMAREKRMDELQIEHQIQRQITKVDHVMAEIEAPKRIERFADGTTQQVRDYLTRVWRVQDASGLKGFNSPEWYKKSNDAS